MPEADGAPHKKGGGGLRGEFWDVLKIFIISLAIVVPIRYFIVQPFIVRGASMEPNFEDGEYLLIDEISYYFREPQRGEIVVFRYPLNPKEYFIKRIIAFPGERVEIGSGQIKIFNKEYPSGFAINEKYLPAGLLTFPDISRTLGPNDFFVLGDNRNASSDSRIWGPLEKKFITGRVLFRAWPITRLGFIPKLYSAIN